MRCRCVRLKTLLGLELPVGAPSAVRQLQGESDTCARAEYRPPPHGCAALTGPQRVRA